MKVKPTPEKMYAIWNASIGFYAGTRITKDDMIAEHTKDVRKSWEDCQKDGDKVLPVLIVPLSGFSK